MERRAVGNIDGGEGGKEFVKTEECKGRSYVILSAMGNKCFLFFSWTLVDASKNFAARANYRILKGKESRTFSEILDP